jgi:hypothetical protein
MGQEQRGTGACAHAASTRACLNQLTVEIQHPAMSPFESRLDRLALSNVVVTNEVAWDSMVKFLSQPTTRFLGEVWVNERG